MEPVIGTQLRTVHHLIRRYVENHSHKKEIDRITGTNGWIIFYLAEHRDRDVFQRDLEKEMHVTRSTASKILQRMEEKDLIRRESVPQDARLKKLTLTPRSLAILDLVTEDQDEMEKQLTKGFSEKELALLSDFLRRMRDNMSTAKGADCVD